MHLSYGVCRLRARVHLKTLSSLLKTWGPFLEGPEKFSHPESHSEISKLMVTELFYSHIININRGSLHTRSFRHIHFSVSDTDELKMALWTRNFSGAFEKRASDP